MQPKKEKVEISEIEKQLTLKRKFKHAVPIITQATNFSIQGSNTIDKKPRN